MFEKWDIPDDICSSFPIGHKNLGLFVGHSEQTKFLSDLLSNKSVIVLEGEIGVGKTSMGNYVRHSKEGFFSPILEIPCKPKWDNDTFMGIVLAAIVKEIMRKDSIHKKLRKNKLIQELNEKFSDIKLANLGISGAGFGLNKGESLSRSSLINQTILTEYLVEVGQLVQENYQKTAPVIIQLNNLDVEYGFTNTSKKHAKKQAFEMMSPTWEKDLPCKRVGVPPHFEKEDLKRFFNEIRDTLQIPCFSWLICGADGLETIVRKNIPRVSQIVNSFMAVNPLSFEEVIKAFDLRIENAGKSGRLPIDLKLLNYIYDVSNGSFREILNIAYQLLVRYYNEPLVKTINMEHARYFFYEIGKHRLERLKRSSILYPVFMAILDNPGINQKNLAALVKKQQANVSRVTGELEAEGYITIKKVSRTNRHYADTKYRIGFTEN